MNRLLYGMFMSLMTNDFVCCSNGLLVECLNLREPNFVVNNWTLNINSTVLLAFGFLCLQVKVFC